MTEQFCGTCYACCVYLDIKELNKWGGQHCNHLNGVDCPEKRCSIYQRRPEACSSYRCAWLQGCFDEDLRPNACGVLVTGYDIDGERSITLNVFDQSRAGSIVDPHSPICRIIADLPPELTKNIFIRFFPGRKVIILQEGKVFKGKVSRDRKLEELKIEYDADGIGRFEIRASGVE